MRSTVLVTVVLIALVLPPRRSAGCFATAGLTAPPVHGRAGRHLERADHREAARHPSDSRRAADADDPG